jgi:RND family efflux transporter MFP subunit
MILLLRRFSWWASLVGILAVVLLVRQTTAIEPIQPPPSAPARKPSARVIAAAGLVESLRENTRVGVPVAALVKEVLVHVWDEVEAGAPLLRLDDRDLQAQLITQRADLRVREAELAKARRQHELSQTLRQDGLVSQEEADSERDSFDVAQARWESARAVVAQTEMLIDRLTVRAPLRGTVLQVNTRAGEYVLPGGDTAPVLLGSIEEVQVRADVDEQIAPRVKSGARAVGYLKGDTENPITLEFVQIEPFITPKRNLTGSSSERVDTRVLQVIYKFPNGLPRKVYVGQQMDLFLEE